tara:strand:+ start:15504 stop:16109 length:606 start_codon:yes stop_codon:yes gene_type:complete
MNGYNTRGRGGTGRGRNQVQGGRTRSGSTKYDDRKDTTNPRYRKARPRGIGQSTTGGKFGHGRGFQLIHTPKPDKYKKKPATSRYKTKAGKKATGGAVVTRRATKKHPVSVRYTYKSMTKTKPKGKSKTTTRPAIPKSSMKAPAPKRKGGAYGADTTYKKTKSKPKSGSTYMTKKSRAKPKGVYGTTTRKKTRKRQTYGGY